MNKSNDITVTRIQDIQQFENLKDKWTQLLSQSAERDIFLTWEWLFAWWKNIGQFENELWLLLFHDGETLIGIAPLMMGQKNLGINFRWLGNLGDPDCDIGGLITIDSENTIYALLIYLEENKHAWDVFELMELRVSKAFTQQFLSILDASRYDVYQTTEKHFYIPFVEKTWQEYYNSLSKNMKHNLKRRVKRISEIGQVKFTKYSGSTLSWKQFQEMFVLNEKSNFPDLYKTEQIRAFHKDLFLLMQNRDWIQIEMLFIDERPIAFQYGFCFEGRYEDWRGGIDKEFETLAPGKLLMMFSLEERFKHGITENDFLRGVYSYKMDWNPSYRDFTTVQIYNRTHIKSRLAYLGLKYIYPIVKAWMKDEKKIQAKESQASG